MMARKSLSAFAIGIVPFMLIKVLAAGFYAKQDMGTPVRIGILAMIANMVFNLILIWPLKHAGIALATSLAAVLNSGFLFYFLQKQKIYQPRDGWRYFAFRLFFANVVLGIWLWVGTADIRIWITQNAWWRAEHLAGMLVSAVVIYFVALALAGVRPRHLLMPQMKLVVD